MFNTGAGDWLVSVKEASVAGKFHESYCRSFLWKVLLNMLDQKDRRKWITETRSCRAEYEKLAGKYFVDPHEDPDADDPEVHNPLSQSENSAWNRFFRDQELEATIHTDVVRTFPEREYFQQPRIRRLQERILFVYAKITPDIVYKQGMHELLAIVLYVLDRELIEKSDATQKEAAEEDDPNALFGGAEMLEFFSAEHLEHDAFWIFHCVMDRVGDFFRAKRSNRNTIKLLHLTGEHESDVPPVVQSCRRIQNQILKAKDPQLQAHLHELEIEPQLYSLAWVRLMLARQFHLDDVFMLWDAIFAYSEDVTLLEYICAAMLIYVRSQILERDYSMALKRLFKYPPVEDVHLFVDQAIRLHQGALHVPPSDHPGVSLTVTNEQPAPPPRSHTRRGAQHSSKTNKAQPQTSILDPLAPLTSGLRNVFSEESSTVKKMTSHGRALLLQQQNMAEVATAELLELKKCQAHLGKRLDRIVSVMQQELMSPEHPHVNDEALLALAELKQIKDIMRGLLQLDEAMFMYPLPGEDEQKQAKEKSLVDEAAGHQQQLSGSTSSDGTAAGSPKGDSARAGGEGTTSSSSGAASKTGFSWMPGDQLPPEVEQELSAKAVRENASPAGSPSSRKRAAPVVGFSWDPAVDGPLELPSDEEDDLSERTAKPTATTKAAISPAAASTPSEPSPSLTQSAATAAVIASPSPPPVAASNHTSSDGDAPSYDDDPLGVLL